MDPDLQLKIPLTNSLSSAGGESSYDAFIDTNLDEILGSERELGVIVCGVTIAAAVIPLLGRRRSGVYEMWPVHDACGKWTQSQAGLGAFRMHLGMWSRSLYRIARYQGPIHLTSCPSYTSEVLHDPCALTTGLALTLLLTVRGQLRC